MAWHRKGLIGNPAGSAEWASTHALLPTPDATSGDGWDLYVSSRDVEGRSRIGRCRLLLGDAPGISKFDPDPVLDLGPLGAFDDSGLTTACLVSHGGAKYLYYTGWTRGVSVPFYLFVGLAISTDGGRTYRRVSDAPLLDRGPGDPYLTAAPCVLVEDGRWRMWYVSGTRWEKRPGTARHYYHIKYMESADGIDWQRPARVAIDYASSEEYAFARPCVIRDRDAYRMWYSYRGDRYRIGGAQSIDGIRWERRDAELGLPPGTDAWENEMVEYPWIVDWQDRRYMLYNGNDYGRTGIGLAVWE